MSSFSFQTSVDDVVRVLSNDIQAKNVIITGASPGGLAAEAARAIVTQQPGMVVLAARKMSLLEETKAEILKATPNANLKLLAFDLGSQDSVRQAAAEILSYKECFDVLLNVGGVMAPPYATTADGIESQFGINHVGPFLFTNLILPKLNKNARIINVTSRGYQLGSILWEDINFKHEPYDKWRAYAQSKSATILFSSALARKLTSKEIQSFSVHPGSINTNLGRHLTPADFELLSGVPMEFKNIHQGAANMVIAAFDQSNSDQNGGHYDDDNQIKPIPEAYAYATGISNEERLWKLSEEVVGQKFTY